MAKLLDDLKDTLEATAPAKETPAHEGRNFYSFRQDKVMEIFQSAIRGGLELPASKRPMEMLKANYPNYSPYHRILGHPIEDCWVLKDIVERKIQRSEVIPKVFTKPLRLTRERIRHSRRTPRQQTHRRHVIWPT